MALAGRRILVTRAAERAAGLVAEIERRGAEVVLLPATRTEDPIDLSLLDSVIDRLAEFDWLVLTSAEGARRFAARAAARGMPCPASLRLAAVGPSTAEALTGFGGPVLVPEPKDAEGLFAALSGAGPLAGRRVLFPKAERAREELPRLLAGAGAEVVEVVAYRTVEDSSGPVEEVGRALRAGEIDVATFLSPSAARSFASLLGPGVFAAPFLVASIGPTTSAAIRDLGGRVDLEAREPGVERLVEAIEAAFEGETARAAREFIARINARDPAGLAALMTEDHRFVDATGAVHAGRDAMLSGWERYFTTFPEYRIEVEEVLEAGGTVAIFGHAAGRTWRIPAAWRARVVAGRVAEWQVYADVEPMLREIGIDRFGKPAP